ncbi:50S ribosomal protein L21 [Jannaschia aquimarina]|uniref:Large ribosomal subunit protein bL21 n=1 Tax=Jannaschia aquimarina TaxID=935700 RepID=A0A0D1D8G1_9RHOB|nr:50S ribosomal protein L21 [Jannaschia aquimarina]KIT16208.1 50S ribosomal protein L21 [Jannaschia aquimarina]SNT39816.1 LSU ribosomal protein L21P [Jannaschia aquimarina]
MFAVMKTGGKQYRVASGDVLRVEKLAAEAGETVQFNDVLMIGGDEVTVGSPTIEGAAVQADVIDQIKGEKLIHFVKRRRKHSSKRTKGHRQQLTLLRVTEILASGGDKSGVKAATGAGSAPASAKAEAPKAKKAASKTSTAMKVAAGAAAAVGAVAATAAVAAAVTGDDTTGSKPSNLLEAPRDGQADDLKKIKGVGPKLEGVLHEIGVYHFDQIAAWGPEEIAYMDDRLSFKGRIERDNWIEKAKELAAEKE